MASNRPGLLVSPLPRHTTPPKIKKPKAFSFLRRSTAAPSGENSSGPRVGAPSPLVGSRVGLYQTTGRPTDAAAKSRPRAASLQKGGGGDIVLEIEGLPKVRLIPPDDEGRPITLYPLSPLRPPIGKSSYQPPPPLSHAQQAASASQSTALFSRSQSSRPLSRISPPPILSSGSANLWGSMSGGFQTPAPVFHRRSQVPLRHGRHGSGAAVANGVVMPRSKREVVEEREMRRVWADVEGQTTAASTSPSTAIAHFDAEPLVHPALPSVHEERNARESVTRTQEDRVSSFSTPPPNPYVESWPVIDFTQSPQASVSLSSAVQDTDPITSTAPVSAAIPTAQLPEVDSPQRKLDRRTMSLTAMLASRSRQPDAAPVPAPPVPPIPTTPGPSASHHADDLGGQMKSRKSLKNLLSTGRAADKRAAVATTPKTPKTPGTRGADDNPPTPGLSKRFSLQNLSGAFRRKEREKDLAEAPALPSIPTAYRSVVGDSRAIRGPVIFPAPALPTSTGMTTLPSPIQVSIAGAEVLAPVKTLSCDADPTGMGEMPGLGVQEVQIAQDKRWSRYSILFEGTVGSDTIAGTVITMRGDADSPLNETPNHSNRDAKDLTLVTPDFSMASEVPHRNELLTGGSSTSSVQTARLAYLADSTPSQVSIHRDFGYTPSTISSSDSLGSLASLVVDFDIQVAVASLVTVSSSVTKARALRDVDFESSLQVGGHARRSEESLQRPSLPLGSSIGYDLSSALHRADRASTSFSSDTLASLSSSLPSAEDLPVTTPRLPSGSSATYHSPSVLCGDDDMEELELFSGAFEDDIDLYSLEDGEAILVTSPRQSPQTSVFSQSTYETPATHSTQSSSQKSGALRLTGPEGLFRFLPPPGAKGSSKAIISQAGKAKRRDTGIVLPQVAAHLLDEHLSLGSLHFEGLGLQWIDEFTRASLGQGRYL